MNFTPQSSEPVGSRSSSDGAIIAVIGAGFSGTLACVQLLNKLEASGNSARILLFDKDGHTARGAAYSTTCPQHLLNVPAARMGAFPDQPEHYYTWLKSKGYAAEPSSFTPRMWYGQYLDEVFHSALSKNPTCNVELRTEEVISVDCNGDFLLELSSGQKQNANCLVLALGHPPPRLPGLGLATASIMGRIICDPWNARDYSDLDSSQELIVIGSGLTAIDVVLEVRASGYKGTITMLSRHGLLPQVHQLSAPAINDPGTIENSLRGVLEYLRRHKPNWRSAVDLLRPKTQSIWQALSIKEKKRFLRHLRPYWDVHRHRVAPEVHATIEAELKNGTLRLLKARVLEVREASDAVYVRCTKRGASEELTLKAQKAINCSGPATGLEMSEGKLTHKLLTKGYVRNDPLGIGIEVDSAYRVIMKSGQVWKNLYALGPLLKGQLWESTAVPELRGQAAKIGEEAALSFSATASTAKYAS